MIDRTPSERRERMPKKHVVARLRARGRGAG